MVVLSSAFLDPNDPRPALNLHWHVCPSKVIIHIGDGKDCALNGQPSCSLGVPDTNDSRLEDGLQRLLAQVEKRQQQFELNSNRAAIFALNMQNSDDSLGRQLVCNNDGVWAELDGMVGPGWYKCTKVMLYLCA